MDIFRLKSGKNNGHRRIWITGQKLDLLGFKHGTNFSREMNPDGSMTFVRGGDGHIVARRSDPESPIIDFKGKWVTDFMGEHSHFEVEKKGPNILIRPVNKSLPIEIRHEIDEVLKEISDLKDKRKPGDANKKIAFKNGWINSGSTEYTTETLTYISWTNLGYRIGLRIDKKLDSYINDSFDYLARELGKKYFKPTSDEKKLLEKELEYRNSIPELDYEGPNTPPEMTTVTSKKPKRCPKVLAIVKLRAEGTCELCKTRAPFINKNKEPFLEVHHVVPLSDNGLDQTTNAVAVCPNCHKRCHHSNDKDAATSQLYKNVKSLIEP